MNKILLMSLDFFDSTYIHDSINFIDNVISAENLVCLYSREDNRINQYNQLVTNINSKFSEPRVYLKSRSEVKNIVSSSEGAYFIVIGKKNKDFELAVNNKLLFLVPQWMSDIEEKAVKYGIPVNDSLQMLKFINAINNQNTWYSSFELPDGTLVYSLSDARYFKYAKSRKEKEVSKIFEDILKKGSVYNYDVYLYHFLSSISNYNTIFNDINVWGIFPSSSGKLHNNEMFNFKEIVRYMMKGQPLRSSEYKLYPNILCRHTPNIKTHKLKPFERISHGCKLHFPSICLNPAYKKNLKGKNVCIFDDYLTHGNSFETARNLLRNAGVNKIVFVTLGTFNKDYNYQNYNFSGDIYSKNYEFNFINSATIPYTSFNINDLAKDEVANLHNIFDL